MRRKLELIGWSLKRNEQTALASSVLPTPYKRQKRRNKQVTLTLHITDDLLLDRAFEILPLVYREIANLL